MDYFIDSFIKKWLVDIVKQKMPTYIIYDYICGALV